MDDDIDLFNDDGYPSEEALEKLKTWPIKD